jgi:hypothetical protein
MATTKKTEAKVTGKQVAEVKDFKKVRVDEREQEWLEAFTKAGYKVSMDKKHLNFTVAGVGVQIAIQKNSLVPYIRFTSDEQLHGLEKIFSVRKYGYEIAMPAKKSDSGDKRFRAVGKRDANEIETALEIVKQVAELKEKTKPVKPEKPAKAEKPAKETKKAPAKSEKKPAAKKSTGKKTA